MFLKLGPLCFAPSFMAMILNQLYSLKVTLGETAPPFYTVMVLLINMLTRFPFVIHLDHYLTTFQRIFHKDTALSTSSQF